MPILNDPFSLGALVDMVERLEASPRADVDLAVLGASQSREEARRSAVPVKPRSAHLIDKPTCNLRVVYAAPLEGRSATAHDFTV